MGLLNREKPNFANIVNVSVGVLNAATAGALGADTNGVTVYTPTASCFASRIDALLISTDDTAAVNVFVYILDGATVIPLGIVNVPLSSGNSGTVANVDALAGTGVSLLGTMIDNTGKRYIQLESTQTLKVSVLANMTAAKKCYVTAIGTDYQNS